jgi:hypothetical protein
VMRCMKDGSASDSFGLLVIVLTVIVMAAVAD